MANIFQNSTKSIPKKPDSQTVRVAMDQIDIGGRKDHLTSCNPSKGPELGISHIGNRGS